MKLGCDVGVTEGEFDGKNDGADVGGVDGDLVYPRMVGLFVASFSFGPSLWRSSSSAK